ncbi:MAG TPA: hypothetical protein VJA64_12815, partial [Desulfobaccales bacterium]|nr:hypothetical protein [Desulfobaccales bacterium]
SWTFGPPVKHEKVSGAGVPACQPVCTGWKACATGRTFRTLNFSRQKADVADIEFSTSVSSKLPPFLGLILLQTLQTFIQGIKMSGQVEVYGPGFGLRERRR